ncbi:MAG: hypothetical protein V4805_19540 [Pseudomonadota bacterium]
MRLRSLLPLLLCTLPFSVLAATFSITATVSGLDAGKRLILVNKDANPKTAVQNGAIAFTGLNTGTTYNLTIRSQPERQTCSVSNGSGTVNNANVSNVAVTCIKTPVVVVVKESWDAPGQTLANVDGRYVAALQANTSLEISHDTTKNFKGSAGSLKGKYLNPAAGQTIWTQYAVPANTREVFVEFRAKMPEAKHGVKFLKIFGAKNGANYANTTFGLDYTGVDYGALYFVGFGDGTDVENDTQNVVLLDGSNPGWIGRSFGAASVQTPQQHNFHSFMWGADWHHFKMRIKFNSGTTALNEVADGAYYLEIDGKVYVDAVGIFNRHYSNGPIDAIKFFDWTQGPSNQAFELWYDDIVISTGDFVSIKGQTAWPAISSLLLTSDAPVIPVQTYSISATVSGLGSGKTVVLQNSNAQTLSFTSNTNGTFATKLGSGTSYAVSVKTQPSGQTCTVSNGSGTIASSNVSNVTVACVTNTYSIVATVSGLGSGQTLVLQNSNAETLSFSTNTSKSFATKLATGAGYGVTVKTQPTGQTCTVSNGSGTIASSNISNVTVACIDTAAPNGTTGLLWPNGIEPGDPSVCEAPTGKKCWWVNAAAATNGSGTFASPYNHFKELEQAVRGGDFVYVKGTFDMATNSATHQMTLNFYTANASGTPAAPTTLKSWRGSPRAVFSANRTSAQLRMSNNGGIRMQNLEITNFGDQGIVVDDFVTYADFVNIVAHDGKVTQSSGVGGGLVIHAQDGLHTFIVRNSLFYLTADSNPDNNSGALTLISELAALPGSTFTAYGNVFHDNHVALRHKHASVVHMNAYNNLFEDNAVAFYLRLFSSDIHHNIMVRNQEGMRLETDGMRADHDYIVRNNTFYDTGFLVSARPDTGGFVANMHIENNIFMDPSGGSGVLKIGADDWTGPNDLSGWSMKNNVFFYTPSNRAFLYAPWPPTVNNKSFAATKTLLGDTTSIYADPLFTNAATGDFSLTAGSPAIGAGSAGTTPGAVP